MRTNDRGSALAQSDLKSLDRMLTAAPAQLLSRLPRPPLSVLDFSEKLYQAWLPQWIDRVDQQMSPCERALERVQHHFIATQVEAETLFTIYRMARVMTAAMERSYIGWCHKLAELSVGSTEVKHASNMRMSLVICAPLYMSAHKGFAALSQFIGCPIPHRTWTDFDAQGNAADVRRAVFWQLVLLLVPMPEGDEEIDILEAIVDAYDLAGCFDAKTELESRYGRGRYRINDVIRLLRKTHVAVVVVHGWKYCHRSGKALWEVLHALREAAIAVVLVATAAIALCKDNRQFRSVFPCDPVEFAAYDIATAANLGRAYAATLGLPHVPQKLVEAVHGLYGFRHLLDELASLIAHRVHQEGMTADAALEGSVDAIHRQYQRVLGPFKHLLQYKSLSPAAVEDYCDLLPLALMSKRSKS